MKLCRLRNWLLVGSAMSVATWASGASAQSSSERGAQTTAIEEVVVTARRREENLQTTPVAITAVTSDTLEKRNVLSLEGIAQIAPSYHTYNTTGQFGGGGSFMRGIGYADNIPGQDSPIGFYIDGVIGGRNGNNLMELVEPERVEVLRGPQGTLFGRNTTGGAILITSHTPGDEFGGMAKASYGNFNTARFQARLDSGLLGDSGLKFSAAFSHHQRDGVRDNGIVTDNLDPGALNGNTYWFKMMGEWERLTATLTADYNEDKGVGLNPQVIAATPAVANMIARSPQFGGRPYIVTTNPMLDIPADGTGGLQQVWSQGVSLTLAYELNDSLTLKSISAVRAYKRHDPSGYGPANLSGPLATGGIGSFNGLYALTDRYQSQRQKTQELQLLGTFGDFDFVAGGFYLKEGAWDFGLTRLPVAVANGNAIFEFNDRRLYTVDSKSIAGFAQANWRPSALDRKLELSGGVRWTKDERNFVQFQNQQRAADLETKNTSFLVSANYQWTPGAMTYLKYSTGYRGGGFNARAVAGSDPVFQPEKLRSFEGGFKLDLLNNRIRVNGAAYYNKYKDLQVGVFVPPGSGTSGGNEAVNANANYKGFELEVQAVPIDGLTLTASVGYVDPTYKKYPTALAAGAVSPGCLPLRSSSGTLFAQDCAATAEFIYFPKTTANASVNYEFAATGYGVWSLFASWYYKGRTQMSAFDAPATPFQSFVQGRPYSLFDAKVTLSDIPVSGGKRARVSLFVDNLTNKTYNAQGIDFQSFATITWGEPRTYGIEGKIEF